MAHWHDYNPWADRLRYISFEDTVRLYGSIKTTNLLEATRGRFDLEEI